MRDLEIFVQEFIRGLRSVPGYAESLCDCCAGQCGEQPDDQCLYSAWQVFIDAAREEGLNALEVGRRCAQARMAVESRAADMVTAGGALP